MRLRGQVLLAAVGVALVFGGVGIVLIGLRAQSRAAEVLQHDLRTFDTAFRQAWMLRRSQRSSVYRAIAQQTYFRAYLQAGDRAQMAYFARAAHEAGASAVVVVSRDRVALATCGETAPQLLGATSRLAESTSLTSLDGNVADVYVVPVGTAPPVGFLVVAEPSDAESLRAMTSVYGIDVAVLAGDGFASTLTGEPAELAADALRRRQRVDELKTADGRLATLVGEFDGARTLLAAPASRVHGLAAESQRLTVALFVVVLALVVVGASLAITRITRPIDLLRQSAEALGTGALNHTIELLAPLGRRSDEIGALARSYRLAARQLADLMVVRAGLGRGAGSSVGAVERNAARLAEAAVEQRRRLLALEADVSAAKRGDALGFVIDALHRLGAAYNVISGLQHLRTLTATSIERALALSEEGQRRLDGDAVDGNGVGGRCQRALARTNAQMRAIATLLEDQRRRFDEVGGELRATENALADAQTLLLASHRDGTQTTRALSVIRQGAERHVADSAILRAAAEGLQRDLQQLDSALSAFSSDFSAAPGSAVRDPDPRS